MIWAIVQARMGSSRLPGKVLGTAGGRTLLEHLLDRLSHARTLDGILVATSVLPSDDAIADLCAGLAVQCFRGSERDVLDRYYRAAEAIQARDIVRITADCPLVDPDVVDAIVAEYLNHRGEVDLVTNRYPLTFPDGMDVDVFSRSALGDAWQFATTARQREHVIPYFWECGKRVLNIEHPDNLFPRYRWTVDYPEDAEVIRRIIEALGTENGGVFHLDDIKSYIDAHPDVAALNAVYLPTGG